MCPLLAIAVRTTRLLHHSVDVDLVTNDPSSSPQNFPVENFEVCCLGTEDHSNVVSRPLVAETSEANVQILVSRSFAPRKASDSEKFAADSRFRQPISCWVGYNLATRTW